METLAHFQGAERRIAFVTFEIEIPDRRVAWLQAADLPKGWRGREILPATQDLGSLWQREGRSVALAVPSVLIPDEHCVMLNPQHPDTDEVMVSYPVAFEFDERL